VRSQVEPIEWAVFEDEINPEPLTRRQYLAVRLSDAIARHHVPDDLFTALQREFDEREIVGLCMAASIAHAGHVLNEAVRLPAAEGVACPLPPRRPG
jgi:alkylhydroperoxidase family enzyme